MLVEQNEAVVGSDSAGVDGMSKPRVSYLTIAAMFFMLFAVF